MHTGLPLPKTFEAAEFERRWYAYWVEQRYFEARPDSPAIPFAMVLPPPNVTGSLHMGHAFGTTLQDVIVRWKRMQGFDTLWLPGIDHAGIATQHVVERQLAKEGQDRWTLGREAFLDRVRRLKEESGATIVSQLKKLGGSFDWSRMRFTLEPQLTRAVLSAFVGLHRRDLIYRGEHIVHACPRCLTAISELEIRHRDVEEKLYTVRFPLAGSDEHVKVSLRRPETLLGAQALAVHPDDERHRHLIGSTVILPLVGRVIPIVSDSIVDRNVGTGVIAVCPAHDMKDFQIGSRHGLLPFAVLDQAGVMTERAGRLAGLDRFKARKEVVVYLRSSHALEGSKPERLQLGYCERCDSLVEPTLSTQWFVRNEPLVGPTIEALEQRKVRFVPEGWAEACIESLRHSEDWCISRQSWWGHPIPAWYCRPEGEGGIEHIVVSEREPAKCETCGGTELQQDVDVLDTWFSASLWPFAALGWPTENQDYRRYYPTDLLVTGPDIVLPWVSRMLMMGLLFTSTVPFKEVYITALVRDERGQKMSKTKGNVVDPLEVLERYGADAVRFTLARCALPAADILINHSDLAESQGLVTKLWSMARFASMQMGSPVESFDGDPHLQELLERWILSRCSRVTGTVEGSLGDFRIDKAAEEVGRFLEEDLLGDYLDALKFGLEKDDSRVVLPVLKLVLDRSLRLFHPFMPFVTEEIWQSLPHDGDSITLAEFPRPVPQWEDADAEAEMTALKSVVDVVRRFRTEYNVGATRKIQVVVRTENPDKEQLLSSHRELVMSLGGVSDLVLSGDSPVPSGAVTEIVDEVEITIGLADIVDRDAEISRLSRDVGRIEKDLEGLAKKLSNPDFTSKATPDVVQAAHERYDLLQEKKKRIQASLRALRHST
jgi:valyl-tRNA synthetase